MPYTVDDPYHGNIPKQRITVTLEGRNLIPVRTQFEKVLSARIEIRPAPGSSPAYDVFAVPSDAEPGVVLVWCSAEGVSDCVKLFVEGL